MKKNNKVLKNHKPSEKNFPPVRKTKKETPIDPQKPAPANHIKSLEYDKWDKYDAGKF